MKTKTLNAGAILACLLLLPACSTPPKPQAIQPARPIVLQPCPPVVACQQPAGSPKTNRQLAQSLLETRQALETCAAQVDTVAACQQRTASQRP
ncbi:Rz1-like lysis system protein LysC [Chromobacterium alkanivorans]|uniref:Rz1-like lysis system protein LysC n=1 Tax=Chromobacterium alkanivorans TaxID=1071719 RepID=UPI003B84A91E